MDVDGGGARQQPDLGRAARRGNGFTHQARSDHSRLLDVSAIPIVVPTIDTPAGQVDDGIRSVDLGGPRAVTHPVPLHSPPRPSDQFPTDQDHVVSRMTERPGQNRPDLAGSSQDDDRHGSSPRPDSFSAQQTLGPSILSSRMNANGRRIPGRSQS